MKQLPIVLFLVCVSHTVLGQKINNYEYVLVPEKFEFLRYADKYQLNSLTTFLFNREGFKAAKNTITTLPAAVATDRCKALYADVKDSSGFIWTKLQIELKDCEGNVLFISEVGKSKTKDFTRAHHEALRMAFESIEALKYSYSPKTEESKPKSVVLQDATNQKKAPISMPTQGRSKEAPLTKELQSSPQVLENPRAGLKEVVYTSDNSDYRIVQREGSYLIYEQDAVIGKAAPTSGDQFLITTDDFSGVGRIEGNLFIIDRKIKGVEGLVQMTFTKE